MDNYFDHLDDDFREKPINWREIFERLLYHWKWFVLSVVLLLMAGFVYIRMQPNIFEAKSTMLIIDQSRSSQMNEMSVLKQLDAAGLRGGGSTSMINNEEKVLTSTSLMNRVVQSLELHTTYIHENYLKRTDLYTDSPIYVRLDSASLHNLNSTLTMEIEPDGTDILVTGTFGKNVGGKHEKVEFREKIAKLPTVINTPAGLVYIQYRAGKNEVDKKITVSINHPAAVAKSLAKGSLKTEVGKLLDVIELSFKSTNAKKSQDALRSLATIYNQDASEQNNLSANNTAKFIDVRLELLARELNEVERQVENYKQDNKLTEISEDARIFQEKSSLFDQRQLEVEMQQNLVRFVDEFLRDPANKNALIPNLGLNDEGLFSVMQAYNQLLLERERITAGVSDENPSIKTLNIQINATRKAILTSIQNVRKGLQLNRTDIGKQNEKIQSKILNIPRQEREFIEIKRQQQVKATLFTFLLQKREEASLNMAVTVPKGRTLNAPDSATLVSPKRNIILLVFLFLGLVLPAVAIYIRDLFNTLIQSRTDVEKYSDIPILTELSHSDTLSPLIDLSANASANSELFRLLRTKLQFTLDKDTDKIILITSSMSGEGKTFVSVNLSAMLSMADKKILLIGLDLRRPQLARIFNFSEGLGISLYLSGQNDDIQSMIKESEDYPGLFVLPAGAIPPNPTELIMKKKFETLIEQLRQEYDYIVIDSAPAGAVSDTFLIDRVSDITIYITRAGFTDRRYLEFANRAAHEKSLKRMYFVINDVNVEAHRYSYNKKYGYGYGIGYGYGYGYGQKKSNE